MDKQRSLAAIVFTDVVGYSALMAADEAQAIELFSKDLAVMRQICSRNDGQVLKTMGDGVLMVFGSAVQAVESALEMQASFGLGQPGEKRLVHRIGIHVGDVVLSENDAQGDGVNVAARLHEAAPPGGIWVSSTVYDIVKGRLPVTGVSRGNHEFKNIPVPVMVFELARGVEFAKPFRVRSVQKPFAAAAVLALSVALVVAGSLVYSASLHPREKIEIIEPAAQNPSPRTAPSATITVARKPQAPAVTVPVHAVSSKVSDPPKPVQQPPNRLLVAALPKPPPKQVQPAKTIAAPPDAGPAGVANAIGAALPNASLPSIDPQQARDHYFFRRYAEYLRRQPEGSTLLSRREQGRWRQMSALKDQALRYLAGHSKESPMTVHMDGPSGAADYKVWAAPLKASHQPIVGVASPDGTDIRLPFGQLTTTQVDAIFAAIGQTLFSDPAATGLKSDYWRQLNMFEDAYGLPKTAMQSPETVASTGLQPG